MFYPTGLARRRELEYLSRKLSSVEINGSFYSLQRPSSYRKWFDQTPDDFLFAVKGSRYITHLKRLREVTEPMATFFASGLLALRHKLGPVLWQLPPNLAFDEEQVTEFLSMLPRSTAAAAELAAGHRPLAEDRVSLAVDADRPMRHAIEVRHPGFAVPRFAELLREQNVALVAADTAGLFPYLDEVTADFVYVRLHGGTELYASGYDDAELADWAARIRGWAAPDRDAYVYFDNTAHGHAPTNAIALAAML